MSGEKGYQLVSSASPSGLSKTVTAKMAEGWEPFGSPFAENGTFCQAMVKTEGCDKRLRKTSGDG